ncbi:hypothetical protein [Caldicellulosiruptor morganii]|uniref:Uncharacterized protein n=1 Tax=Caldicellulosiruptor morganii TaxID=1387555 RepID=A0ABY7BM66_9FIRM|nr:hypothetical protein [Caldicellulosiruptor morganii]WAM33910.1 hypothetical protein OTK00_000050 [Caldicellulosiruptor morganii]
MALSALLVICWSTENSDWLLLIDTAEFLEVFYRCIDKKTLT